MNSLQNRGEAPFLRCDPGPESSHLNLPASVIVPMDQVKVFIGEVAAGGQFNWRVPEGNWTILRLGYASTGRTISSATNDGRGLEADKLDSEPVLKSAGEKEIGKTWVLSVQKNLDAPETPLVLEELTDWTRHQEFGVRHFSGTATYKTTFNLGEVRVMAQALVNGKEAAMLWKPPFKTDITTLLVAGENQLEVKVTNVWANRLIGDEYYPDEMDWNTNNDDYLPKSWPDWLWSGVKRPASPRVTWITKGKIYCKDDPLLPSGLLGPVKLITASTIVE